MTHNGVHSVQFLNCGRVPKFPSAYHSYPLRFPSMVAYFFICVWVLVRGGLLFCDAMGLWGFPSGLGRSGLGCCGMLRCGLVCSGLGSDNLVWFCMI